MFIRLPILDKIFYLLIPKWKRPMYEAIDSSDDNDYEDTQSNTSENKQSIINNDQIEILDESVARSTPNKSRSKTIKIV